MLMGDTGTNNREAIRTVVASIYGIQKLRVGAGNRLCQSFYQSMGVKPSESPDDADKEQLKMIKQLQEEYDRLSDAVVSEQKTIKRKIKELTKGEEDEGISKEEDAGEEITQEEKDVNEEIDQAEAAVTKKRGRKKKIVDSSGDFTLKYIRSETDYYLIDSYQKLLESEQVLVKVLDKYVKEHPLWDKFFKGIKGCGPMMAGVCIAYLDPYQARHVSCFFKYAGLDVVQDVDKDGNKLYVADGNASKVLAMVVREGGSVVYRDVKTGELFDGDVFPKFHGRRKGDTEMQEYIDSDGNVQRKRGITYNPKLKTKLMGVLAGGLLKAKDPKYSEIYYDYRNRLDHMDAHKEKKPAQKHMMSQRYMIKQFLRDLWTTWRTLEGLEVDLPYEVAKLGNKPHKYNEYQCNMATKSVAEV